MEESCPKTKAELARSNCSFQRAKLAASQAPQQMQELAGLVEKQAEELGCSESG